MRSAPLLVLLLAAGAAAQSYSGSRQFRFPVAGAQAPAVTRKVAPEYTAAARRAQVEGTVLLYAEIGADGRAHRIHVVRGLGYGLDQKAVDAVGQWRFAPGTKDGSKTTTPATIEVEFRLGNSGLGVRV